MNPEFDAVLFDCDGVLVDSEPITNGVLRQMLAEAGWALSQAECEELFVGRTVRDQRARIERETGQALTDAWMRAFYARRDLRLRAELQPVPGALDAVIAAHRRTGARTLPGHRRHRHRCASRAGRRGHGVGLRTRRRQAARLGQSAAGTRVAAHGRFGPSADLPEALIRAAACGLAAHRSRSQYAVCPQGAFGLFDWLGSVTWHTTRLRGRLEIQPLCTS